MPIARSYMCETCGHRLEVVLPFDDWDKPPPDCPQCSQGELAIDFRPIALRGTRAQNRAEAVKIAETIATEDYHVADFKSDGRPGGRAKVRYKDQNPTPPTQWGATADIINTAAALGRETRLKYGGDGLDMLQRALKEGAQPDLIAQSKARSMKIW